ncbi:hypothetical protein [Paludibaculum fermentans]|uniref:Uncharacterized protein n=1 Tax=Paludibaculum fermentans TaxID=1473598 RepID=A0A7S7NU51_PALFE|nr:hypothetical protein [Paludibaculum fermentans]QOY89788.1 hypothetical protein IRI77_07505 [Paludibaculum fermentans]
MFNCDLRVDITLSEKAANGRSQAFKAVVKIRLMQGEGDGGKWAHMDTRDFRLPQGGNFVILPTGILLKDGGGCFALLLGLGVPPSIGARGDLKIYTPGQRDYNSPTVQWRGNGKWEVLAKQANLPLKECPTTWGNMKKNFSKYGKGLGWELCSSSGQSLSGGMGGRGIEISIMSRLYMKPVDDEKGKKMVVFSYNGIGAGYMVPGFAASGSTSDFTNVGTELTQGNLPLDEPLRPEELNGMCQVLSLTFGAIAGPGAGFGGAASAMGVIFGVPAGLAVGAFKACAWIAGPVASVGKAGANIGAVLQVGSVSLL